MPRSNSSKQQERRTSPRRKTKTTGPIELLADSEDEGDHDDETTTVRRKLRSTAARVSTESAAGLPPRDENEEDDGDESSVDEEDGGQESEEEPPVEPIKHVLDGVEYATYMEMVTAKRKRNQDVLRASGLLSLASSMRAEQKRQKQQRGLVAAASKRQKTATAAAASRRSSDRLKGIRADGRYVERELAQGRVDVANDGTGGGNYDEDNENEEEKEPENYRNRINDGSDLTIEQAVSNVDDKWLTEASVASAQRFVRNRIPASVGAPTVSPALKKPQSKVLLQKKLDTLRVDDVENDVAKVVPDRIYGIAVHPSPDALLVSAGDKRGYVGLWNAAAGKVNDDIDDKDGEPVHLFKFHSGAASCLQWTRDGSSLFSASYDGTVRLFDVKSESFREVFAAYDSQLKYKDKPGYKVDTGCYKFWTQYACLDSRNEQCFFLSTSVGTALHVDLRTKAKVTFHEQLSDKKINTLRCAPFCFRPNAPVPISLCPNARFRCSC